MINRIPLIISISGALLVVFVQEFVRARVHASGFAAILWGSAPNFLVGFWFPFSILLRPEAFARATYDRLLFPVWCAGALLVLCWFEVFRPLRGAQTFDYFDVVASFLGVGLAALTYYLWLRGALSFGRDEK